MSRDYLKAQFQTFFGWQLIHFSNPYSDDYIGQKLREKSFDPKGKRTSSVLDDLVKTQYQIL